MKSPMISDLVPGPCSITVAIAAVEERQTAGGKPYLSLTLQDRSARIEARWWDTSLDKAQVAIGDIIAITKGEHGEYQGRPQITIRTATSVADYNVRDFARTSETPPDELFRSLRLLIENDIGDDAIRELLLKVLDDYPQPIKMAPAASRNHHAYVGGLLEHMLSMCRMVPSIADNYGVSRDLLYAGAILHDIGKMFELEVTGAIGAIQYGTDGRLCPHVAFGMLLLYEVATRINDNRDRCGLPPLDGPPSDLLVRIRHMILSHHGEIEFGAAVVPQTPEAIALHQLDMLDSRMAMCREALQTRPGEPWTERHAGLGRAIYRGKDEPK